MLFMGMCILHILLQMRLCTSGRRTSGGMGDFDRNLLVGGSTEFFYQYSDAFERSTGIGLAVFCSVFCNFA